jgi:hypothetical protein
MPDMFNIRERRKLHRDSAGSVKGGAFYVWTFKAIHLAETFNATG